MKPKIHTTFNVLRRQDNLLRLNTVLAGVLLAGLSQAASPKLKLDPTPVAKGAGVTATYAPAIQNASPSVVYIYTTKKIQGRNMQPLMPFLNDPLFRRFFDIPEGQEPNFRSVPREEHGLGSGVIISPDGYILTNNHVVADADDVQVHYKDKDFKANIIGTDPRTDVAVVKIQAPNLPAITLTDSDHLKVGDVVLAIGNPFGVGKTVTMGIVSATGRSTLHLADYENFIQTDAAINPGNSGGALIDAKGRLVGINTAIISRSGGNQGIGFAIPVNLARNVMQNLLENGKVVRGYLGVMIQPVTPELAEAFHLPVQHGALIGEVRPGTPASKAGLRVGDVVVAMNGSRVKNSSQFRLRVAQTQPGTSVKLRIIRDRKTRNITVKLGELDEKRAMAKEGAIDSGQEGTDLLDGIEVADLNPRWRQQFQIPDRIRGAVVIDVDSDSAAFRAGLRPGDVILSINQQPVNNADRAVELSGNIKGKQVLLRVWSQGGSHFLVVKKQ